MKKIILLIISLLPITASFALPNQVVIIRHGEKPNVGNNLSCAGFNRALKLASILPLFGNFTQVYVPSLQAIGDTTQSARMLQTATPFVTKYNININSQYPDSEAGDEHAATAILAETGEILIIWDHTNIPLLAQDLGVVNPPSNWPSNDFDSVWIITFPNGAGQPANLALSKENIYPTNNCNF